MVNRLRFWLTCNRIGPDIPATHWLLHFKGWGRAWCVRRLRALGERSEIRPGAYLVATHRISIGDDVVIRPGTMLFASDAGPDSIHITIEDKALIGSGVHVYVSNHRSDDPDVPIFDQGHQEVRPVRIGAGSWIGANAVILPGVTIGEGAVVGAGSVVVRDVPPRAHVGGAPARPLGTSRAATT